MRHSLYTCDRCGSTISDSKIDMPAVEYDDGINFTFIYRGDGYMIKRVTIDYSEDEDETSIKQTTTKQPIDLCEACQVELFEFLNNYRKGGE